MYRRMGSKGRFSNIENAERFIKSLDSVCHEPKFLEIWMADLGDKNGSIQCGRRPVLIVSNDKNNRYSTTVNVMPMTTKMNKRNLPCHVEIFYGFYEHIVRKYGREEAKRMILSDNDGRVNMILLDEADVYGVGENLSPTQLRKTIRQCVFPDR